jgi:CHAT domain
MSGREYIDFKLFLTASPESKGVCQVAVLPTPEVGEAITPVTVSLDNTPRADLLAQLASKTITLANLAILGNQLAECLLPSGPIRSLFRDAYRFAGDDRGVRLRLILADHALKQLPWEFLYVDLLGGAPDSMRGFLSLDKTISILRHEALPFPHPTLTPAPAGLRELPVLIVAAAPEGEEQLDLDGEIGTIEEALQHFDLGGLKITSKVLRDATEQELSNALLGEQSTPIFHFAGHGGVGVRRDDFNRDVLKGEGYVLLLTDHTGRQKRPLSADDLARELKRAGTRLAVLNSCYSGTRNATYPWSGVASALSSSGIPAIMAMQFKVKHVEAEAFSRAFYAALALGLSLDEAVWSGRVAMLKSGISDSDAAANVEWGVPVLYSRLPDGALFPERIKVSGAGPSAEAFRKVFTQTVTGIQEGTMTGVSVELIQNGVKIVQMVKEARGQIIGIKAGTADANANIVVEQKIENVTGTICGGYFNTL